VRHEIGPTLDHSYIYCPPKKPWLYGAWLVRSVWQRALTDPKGKNKKVDDGKEWDD